MPAYQPISRAADTPIGSGLRDPRDDRECEGWHAAASMMFISMRNFQVVPLSFRGIARSRPALPVQLRKRQDGKHE